MQPVRQIAWTGQASGLTAIHVWTLAPLAYGKTLVRTDESMAGFPSSLFYSSAELGDANAAWLRRLKVAAEAVAHAPRGRAEVRWNDAACEPQNGLTTAALTRSAAIL